MKEIFINLFLFHTSTHDKVAKNMNKKFKFVILIGIYLVMAGV